MAFDQFNTLAQQAGTGFSLTDSISTLGSDVPGYSVPQLDPNTGQQLPVANNSLALGNPKFGDASNVNELFNNSNFFNSGSSATSAGSSGTAQNKDMRIRLGALDGKDASVYGPRNPSNILSILYDTQGLMFPYTPQIEWAQQVEYSPVSLTHSNEEYFSYKNTPNTNLTVSGEFTVQNLREGKYMLACIHFLRTVSKMFFGVQSGDMAGMPPPVLKFSGYGNFMFNDLPVIVRNHAYSLPKDVDYLDIKTAGGVARLPVILTISLSLTVQNTPKAQREDFNLDKFRTGELMTNSKGWI